MQYRYVGRSVAVRAYGMLQLRACHLVTRLQAVKPQALAIHTIGDYSQEIASLHIWQKVCVSHILDICHSCR